MNASRYPKEEVLTALVKGHAAVAPLCFGKQGMNFVFYVETRQQANALTSLDKQIPLQDGSALNIRYTPFINQYRLRRSRYLQAITYGGMDAADF